MNIRSADPSQGGQFQLAISGDFHMAKRTNRVRPNLWYVSDVRKFRVALPRLLADLRRRGDPRRHLPASSQSLAVTADRLPP